METLERDIEKERESGRDLERHRERERGRDLEREREGERERDSLERRNLTGGKVGGEKMCEE